MLEVGGHLLLVDALGKRDAPREGAVAPFAAVDAIVAEMHEDGTLTAMSEEWYGLDLTTQQ